MRNRNRRGNALFEFSMVTACFIVPILLGVFAFGFNLLQQLEAIQFCRDAGHLWVTTVVPLGDDTFANALTTMGVSAGYPNGAQVIFSQLVYVDNATCALGGKTAPCTNSGKWAYTQYKVFGTAPPGYASMLGAPSVQPLNSNGTVNTDGKYLASVTAGTAGVAVGTTLPRILISTYNTDPGDGVPLPSGQTINLVEVGLTPFNIFYGSGTINLTALKDFAVF